MVRTISIEACHDHIGHMRFDWDQGEHTSGGGFRPEYEHPTCPRLPTAAELKARYETGLDCGEDDDESLAMACASVMFRIFATEGDHAGWPIRSIDDVVFDGRTVEQVQLANA